jgi:hypothetical protein
VQVPARLSQLSTVEISSYGVARLQETVIDDGKEVPRYDDANDQMGPID